MTDEQLLIALEAEIPILAEKLRTMKITRKRLKAAQTMADKWRDPAFRAKATPSGARNQDGLTAYNAARRLPWPEGSTPQKRYRALMRKGWTRPLAIEKVRAEAA